MTTESTRVVERSLLRAGKKYDADLLAIRLRSGGIEERVVIRHPGACVIVPILGEALVLVRNRRHALGLVLLECPAGTIEPPEAPQACATRELREEAGCLARELLPLGRFYTTPGMTDECMHAFAGVGLTRVEPEPEPDEDLGVELMEFDRVWHAIDSGELRDAKSILAIFLAARRGLIPGA